MTVMKKMRIRSSAIYRKTLQLFVVNAHYGVYLIMILSILFTSYQSITKIYIKFTVITIRMIIKI